MEIKLVKKYGENKEQTFDVNNKDDFIWVVGNMWDAMEEQIKEETTPKDSWDEILKETPFDTKEEFIAWLDEMKKYDLVCKDFDWFEYREQTVNEFIEEKSYGEFSDYEEMHDKVEELSDKLEEIEGAMSEIHNIASNYK